MPSSSPAPAANNLLTDLDFNFDFLNSPVKDAMLTAHATEILTPIANVRKLRNQVADLALEICAREELQKRDRALLAEREALQVRDRDTLRILSLEILAIKNSE